MKRSSIRRSACRRPTTRADRILPIDRKSLVHFDILAGLHATAAKNALIRIVTIKRIGRVDFVRLGLEGNFLMLDRQPWSCYGSCSCRCCCRRPCNKACGYSRIRSKASRCAASALADCGQHLHSGGNRCRAARAKLSVDLDHTGVARLNRAELWVVTDRGTLFSSRRTVDR